MAYALYQAQRKRKTNTLLRSIGFYTASAFLATCVWLLMARFNLVWATVVCILWILFSLAVAFYKMLFYGQPLSRTQRLLVMMPLSIFLGWVSVATFANMAAALKASGLLEGALLEQYLTLAMLLMAGSIGAWVTFKSQGNTVYAFTVMWALIGISVANLWRSGNVLVITTAALMAVIILISLLMAYESRHMGHRS